MPTKTIKDIYSLKKGSTYWIIIGDENTPATQKDLNDIILLLEKFKDEFTFIVTSHVARPVMVECPCLQKPGKQLKEK